MAHPKQHFNDLSKNESETCGFNSLKIHMGLRLKGK
jgi:hypothetical protein